MGLPQNIKERRKELGLTLAEIAKMVGVTEATVQRWESGNIKNLRQERIASLAVALGTTPAYLMGWENESTNEEKPPTPEEQEQEARTARFTTLFSQLSADEQRLLIAQMQGILARKE